MKWHRFRCLGKRCVAGEQGAGRSDQDRRNRSTGIGAVPAGCSLYFFQGNMWGRYRRRPVSRCPASENPGPPGRFLAAVRNWGCIRRRTRRSQRQPPDSREVLLCGILGFCQSADLRSPRVWIDRDPVSTDHIGKLIAGDAELRSNYQIGVRCRSYANSSRDQCIVMPHGSRLSARCNSEILISFIAL
jgi:hypothetical protein